jgi:hypothetical protein
MSDAEKQVFKMEDSVGEVRPTQGSAVLPTGLLDDDGDLHTEVVFREMGGYEEDILTSRLPVGKKMNQILENCIQRIGTIDHKHESWGRYVRSLVTTDRLFILIRIRILSLGNLLRFRTTCPDCGKSFTPAVNLEDFHVIGMKRPKDRVWSGEFPRCKLPYKAKVQTGWDEEKTENKKFDQKDLASMVLLQRLVEVDGKKPTLELVKSLSLIDRRHLRSELENSEGEIDNKVEMVCPNVECGAEFDSEIEIGNADFFFPSET